MENYILYIIIYILLGYIAYLMDIRKQTKEMLNSIDYGSTDGYNTFYESKVKELLNKGNIAMLLIFIVSWWMMLVEYIVHFLLDSIVKLLKQIK